MSHICSVSFSNAEGFSLPYTLTSTIAIGSALLPRKYSLYSGSKPSISRLSDLPGMVGIALSRLRERWSRDNITQNCPFDLTSGQFGDEVLIYDNSRSDNPDYCKEQFREKHFAKEEKRLRYEYLKAELKKYCDSHRFCDAQHNL